MTHYTSDRGAFTSPRPIHPYSPRCITVREAARLHSYPDSFRFHTTKWHGFRQVGNSVPPLLAKAVASGIIEGIGCEPRVEERRLGDPKLLELNMSQAAEYYGVPSTVIPQRILNLSIPRPRFGNRSATCPRLAIATSCISRHFM